MTIFDDVYPGSVRQWETILIDSSSTNKQLVRGPWPLGQKLVIRKLVLSHQSGIPCSVNIWDQDLSSSSTTPPGRGSATSPLLLVGAGATNTSGSVVTTTISETALPIVTFEAGVAVSAVGFPGTLIVAEFERV